MIRRIRLGFVVVICVVLQTTLFTHLRIDGVAPDVGLVAVLAVAYYDGAEAGAWFGFVMGLAIDLFLTTPLGLSALSFAITAYGVGVFQSRHGAQTARDRPVARRHRRILRWPGVPLHRRRGRPERVSLAREPEDVVIAAAYDALIAPIVFPLVRRAARTAGTSNLAGRRVTGPAPAAACQAASTQWRSWRRTVLPRLHRVDAMRTEVDTRGRLVVIGLVVVALFAGLLTPLVVPPGRGRREPGGRGPEPTPTRSCRCRRSAAASSTPRDACSPRPRR